jgi:aryl-alcohol dehydrogenase-like predicted oxidoreductase
LGDVIEAGLARSVGVSNFDVAQMRRAHAVLAKRGIPLASNQVEYSLMQRAPERSGLTAACRELGVTLIAYSPIGKGMLSGKYSAQNPPPGPRALRYPPNRLAALQPTVERLQELARAYERTPSQIALNWLLCKGSVPIPGVKNARQVRDNAGALGWRLRDDDVRALDEVSQA